MAQWLLRKRGWMFVLLAGAMPLGTVADCGYIPGSGGTLYYDSGNSDRYYGGGYDRGGVVIVEDYGYDDYYYDDYYYDDYYYEDVYFEDDYCDPYLFWDCWW